MHLHECEECMDYWLYKIEFVHAWFLPAEQGSRLQTDCNQRSQAKHYQKSKLVFVTEQLLKNNNSIGM